MFANLLCVGVWLAAALIFVAVMNLVIAIHQYEGIRHARLVLLLLLLLLLEWEGELEKVPSSPPPPSPST